MIPNTCSKVWMKIVDYCTESSEAVAQRYQGLYFNKIAGIGTATLLK